MNATMLIFKSRSYIMNLDIDCHSSLNPKTRSNEGVISLSLPQVCFSCQKTVVHNHYIFLTVLTSEAFLRVGKVCVSK